MGGARIVQHFRISSFGLSLSSLLLQKLKKYYLYILYNTYTYISYTYIYIYIGIDLCVYTYNRREQKQICSINYGVFFYETAARHVFRRPRAKQLVLFQRINQIKGYYYYYHRNICKHNESPIKNKQVNLEYFVVKLDG